MQWIIMKKTRAYPGPTRRNAYCNTETCVEAGVEPGKVYDDEEEAKRDAEKLGQANTVGFVAVLLGDAQGEKPCSHL